MRFINKYKFYPKLKFFFETFPTERILKFKTTKWLALRKKIQKHIAKLKKKKKISVRPRKSRFFKDLSLVRLSLKRLVKLQYFYRESLNLKRAIFMFYDQAVSIKYFKRLLVKNYSNKSNLKSVCLIEPLFNIEILLWKLGLFSSVYEIYQNLASKKILVNNKPKQVGYKVKEGDILSFSLLNLNAIKFRLIYLFSFIEIDYYQNKIVVLKDYKSINENDMSLLIKHNIDLSKFKYYIKQK